MDWIERKARVTPRAFLDWYLRRLDSRECMLKFESCIETMLKECGVEEIEMSLYADMRGYIRMRAGAQTVVIRPPKWMVAFVDRVGSTAERMGNRYQVIMALADLIEESVP